MTEIYYLTISTVKSMIGTKLTFTTADAGGVIRLFDVDTADDLQYSAKYSTPSPMAVGPATLALNSRYLAVNNISPKGKVKEPAAFPSELPRYHLVPIDAAKLTLIGASPASTQSPPHEVTIELFDVQQARQGQWIYVAPDGRLMLVVSEATRAALGVTGTPVAGSPFETLTRLASAVGNPPAHPRSDDELFADTAAALALTKRR